MRADRLVAELLYLQARQKVTAAELAREFEVSVKTARRDLEAMSMAGIPVYPQRGRSGGWRLLGGARTNLTGLKSDEARALFFATAQIDENQHPGLKAALSKVTGALPETLRADVERVSRAVYVDPDRWGRSTPSVAVPAGAMAVLQSAVLDRYKVQLRYRDPAGRETDRLVSPLGLVAKASTWYLVAMTDRGRRTFRLDRIVEATPTDQVSEVPADFDLGSEWDDVRASYGKHLNTHQAEIEVDDWALRVVRYLFAGGLRIGDRNEAGRTRCTVSGADYFHVAAQLAGLERGVEVIGPVEVRTELASIGQRLVDRYSLGTES